MAWPCGCFLSWPPLLLFQIRGNIWKFQSPLPLLHSYHSRTNKKGRETVFSSTSAALHGLALAKAPTSSFPPPSRHRSGEGKGTAPSLAFPLVSAALQAAAPTPVPSHRRWRGGRDTRERRPARHGTHRRQRSARSLPKRRSPPGSLLHVDARGRFVCTDPE